jgi:uncharacterized protein YlaN (UPF0358 family)
MLRGYGLPVSIRKSGYPKFQYVAIDILNLEQPQIDEVTEILHRDSGGLSEQIMFGIHLGKVTHSVFGFYL